MNFKKPKAILILYISCTPFYKLCWEKVQRTNVVKKHFFPFSCRSCGYTFWAKYSSPGVIILVYLYLRNHFVFFSFSECYKESIQLLMLWGSLDGRSFKLFAPIIVSYGLSALRNPIIPSLSRRCCWESPFRCWCSHSCQHFF